MASEIKVDTISENTAANGVTVDGVLIKDGLVDGVDVSTLSVDTNGLVLVDSHSFSTQSSISRDNVFTSSYNNYLIHLNLTAVTNQGQARLRFRASGTDNSSANYNNIIRYSNYSTGTFTSSNEGGNPVTSFFFGYNSTTDFGNTQMNIINPQSSLNTQIAGNYQFVNVDGNDIMGSMTVKTAYDGFTIYPLNGTLSGELFVYGYSEG
jgi:hypothetical protein